MSDYQGNQYVDTFFIVPRYILNLPNLKFSYLKVFESVFQFLNKGKPCFLSNSALEKRTGLARRQIQYAIDYFIKHQVLVRKDINGKRFLLLASQHLEIEDLGGVHSSARGGAFQCTGGVHSSAPINKEDINKEDININKNAREKNLTKEEYPETYYLENTEKQEPIGQQLACQQTRALNNASRRDVDDFERFWHLYPYKTNKPRVEALWHLNGCNQIAGKIISKLEQQIKKDKAFLDGCVRNPAKYLQEAGWDDEVYEGKKSTEYDHTDTSWAFKRDIFDD